VLASYGRSSATIAVYLLSPALIALAGWKSVFLTAGVCALVMLGLWMALCPEPGIVQTRQKDQAHTAGGKKLLFSPMMLGIIGAIILHGMLKDGVSTWMPTYIAETYHANNLIAILSSVVMPIFSMVCLKFGSWLYRKHFTNPVACAAAIFGGSTAAAALLALLSGASAPLSVLLMALLTGSMHGVNLMLISTIPPFFKPYGLVSTASGLLNACTYVGSAISTYAIASLSGALGWSFTLWSWVLIAACAGGLCLLCTTAFRKKML
jgi:OPA family glycerol-3-phosphate transporter-like MFS transporter